MKHSTLRLALSLAALCVLAGAPASAQMVYSGPATGARNLFPVLIDMKWGYVDREGALAIQPQFCGPSGFSEGLAVAVTCGYGPDDTEETNYYQTYRYGFIDKTGKFVFGPRREEVPESFRGGPALVHVAGGPAYIDRGGNFVWKPSPPR
ncbi:MAG TPA: WG repeat-containing protein [Pyrinomonadaceae bacterium]|jgi:hypothetical protein|nr:WG repeat-containing protein [Pyrinomonadaceae bacterium]